VTHAGGGTRSRSSGVRRILLRLLLVVLFAGGLATLAPGIASAEGEQVIGTLQTSRSGPIDGVQVTVTTPSGDAVGEAKTDKAGKFAIDVPGPGQYVVTIDKKGLPDTVKLNGEDTRTVTVGPNRAQPVLFGLSDGSRTGGGTIRAVQLLVDGLRFGLLIAMCAVGLSLIFGTTGLTNFAHGELVTIGAIIAWYINVRGGVPLIPATLIAMVAGAAVGALNELALWRPLRRRGTGLVAALVVSIGLSLALRYLIQIFYGGFSNPYADYQNQRAVNYGVFTLTNRALFSIII
jgi:neutral amino acid transport system permease protein